MVNSERRGKNTIAHPRGTTAVVEGWAITVSQNEKVFFRYDPTPVSGLSRGLLLVLDRHSDLAAASSIPDNFKVRCDTSFHREEKIYVVILGLGSNN